MNAERIRLASLLRSVGAIAVRLRSSLVRHAGILPPPPNALAAGDPVVWDAVDAFLQRWEQLADHLLRKLFPALVAEATQSRDLLTRVQLLATLERLALIGDAKRWFELGELRNRLVHEYPDELAKLASDLALAWEWSAELLAAAEACRDTALHKGLIDDA